MAIGGAPGPGGLAGEAGQTGAPRRRDTQPTPAPPPSLIDQVNKLHNDARVLDDLAVSRANGGDQAAAQTLRQQADQLRQKADGLMGNTDFGGAPSGPAGPSAPARAAAAPAPAAAGGGGGGGGGLSSIQDMLRQAGYDPGPSDGVMGPRTRNAIRAFQQARGLAVDGVVGPKTMAALQGGGGAPAGQSRGIAPATAPGAPATAAMASTAPPAPDPATQVSIYGKYRLNPDGTVTQTISDPNAALDAKIATAFGYERWMLDVPELRTILEQAQAGSWTPDAVQAAIQQTDWFKQHGQNVLDWLTHKATDPAGAQADLNTEKAAITAEAQALGVNIDPNRLASMAEDSLSNKWGTAQRHAAIAAEYHYDPKALQSGTAATYKDRFQSAAGDYMVPISDETMGQWVGNAVSGKTNEDGFKQYLQQQAKSLYPGLSAAIDQGVTVKQFSDPYRQVASRELGVAPDSLNFEDPKWNRFLNTVDPTTGARTSASLADMTRVVRSDPTYGFERSARGVEMYSNFAQNLLTEFGGVTKGGNANFQNYGAV